MTEIIDHFMQSYQLDFIYLSQKLLYCKFKIFSSDNKGLFVGTTMYMK